MINYSGILQFCLSDAVFVNLLHKRWYKSTLLNFQTNFTSTTWFEKLEFNCIIQRPVANTIFNYISKYAIQFF